MLIWITYVFGDKGNITGIQECARAALIFAYGLLLVRVGGRRIFGKWSALDIIVSIIVGSNLSRALTGSAPLLGTLAATTVLIALHWILAQLAARHPAISHIVEGQAVQLGISGRVDPTIQKRHSVTEADLSETLRQAGIERVEDSSKLVLEPSGKISVLKSR